MNQTEETIKILQDKATELLRNLDTLKAKLLEIQKAVNEVVSMLGN